MTSRGWIHIVAGRNGAGKTTLAGQLFGHVPVIDPDRIATRFSPDASANTAFAAGRRAIEELQRRLRVSESFGTETTLSGRWIFRFIEDARTKGYGLEPVYVGVEGQRLAIQRVKERAEAGGHDVPEAAPGSAVDVRPSPDPGAGRLHGPLHAGHAPRARPRGHEPWRLRTARQEG